jgi:crotonobetainyl-CoA:carnitine CoA-transferase CaiB-like acyl-CoA transferase
MVGRADLEEDPRFASAEGRSQNFDAVYSFVADEMHKRTTEEWLAALEEADIPVQRMNSLEDILRDPHLAAIGYFTPVEHPSEGTLLSMKVPSEWSETQPEYRRHAPRFGEHTREVLKEAGYSDAQIDALAASGAARL